jgi:hypothetical protein
MATDTIAFSTLSVASTTTDLPVTGLSNLTFLTIINNGENAITIAQESDNYATTMTLAAGQGITFTAGANMTLPPMRVVTGAGTTLTSIAHN